MASSHLFLVMVAMVTCCQGLSKLKVIHSWDSIDYHWPSHQTNASRQVMIELGHFIPGNAIPFDVDWWNGRVFVTTPRLRPGIPATLSTISPYGDELNPVLHPYPNWSWHEPGVCKGITSASSIQVDECGFLWVLDMGNVADATQTKVVCPKKLLVFRLSSNKVIRVHRFQSHVYSVESELKTIIVDVDKSGEKCLPTFAYIADSSTSGLIVYDRKNDRSWRINANNFHPVPEFGHFNIAGSEFDRMVGIYGMALSPYSDTNPRRLYYHSLASNTEGYVMTNVIQQEDLFNHSRGSVETMKKFKTFSATRDEQTSSQAMDENGVLFFSYLSKMTLNCWRSSTPYERANIIEVDKDIDMLQFVSSTKVVKRKDGTQDLLVLSNRIQKLLDNTMTTKEINFRIMKASFDSCDRLWVLDSGTIHTEDHHPERICPPRFFIFQMSNNILNSSHKFSHKLFKSNSVLSSFVLDVQSPASNCSNSFAYIADPPSSGLIVYNHHRKFSWRVEANNFWPLPSFGYFNIDGAEFNSMQGLNALALTPNARTRKLYYHSWSGNTENYVSTEILKSQALFIKGPISKTTQAEFTTHAKKREGQATSMAISSKGTMFFGNILKSAITCWNTASEFAPDKLFNVDQDNSQLRFVSGMKVVQRADGIEEVWVLSNNYHKYKTDKIDKEQVNHRIMTATVSDLVEGKAC